MCSGITFRSLSRSEGCRWNRQGEEEASPRVPLATQIVEHVLLQAVELAYGLPRRVRRLRLQREVRHGRRFAAQATYLRGNGLPTEGALCRRWVRGDDGRRAWPALGPNQDLTAVQYLVPSCRLSANEPQGEEKSSSLASASLGEACAALGQGPAPPSYREVPRTSRSLAAICSCRPRRLRFQGVMNPPVFHASSIGARISKTLHGTSSRGSSHLLRRLPP